MTKAILIICLTLFAAGANAAMVSNGQLYQSQNLPLSAQERQQLQQLLPDGARQLAYMSASEQRQLLQHFKDLPAGATGIEALIVVATAGAALLMTDAMGMTDVVPFIAPEKVQKLEPIEHY